MSNKNRSENDPINRPSKSFCNIPALNINECTHIGNNKVIILEDLREITKNVILLSLDKKEALSIDLVTEYNKIVALCNTKASS